MPPHFTALLIISALQRTTKMLMGIEPYTSPEPEDAVILYFFSSFVVHLVTKESKFCMPCFPKWMRVCSDFEACKFLLNAGNLCSG
jgi:hypothetical protein